MSGVAIGAGVVLLAE